MNPVMQFLTRRRDARAWHWTDVFTVVYLSLGVILMFGPVIWLVLGAR